MPHPLSLPRPPVPFPRTNGAVLPLCLVLLLGVLLAPASCRGEAPKAAAAPAEKRLPLVRTAPVEVRKVRREIETTAFLEAEHHVTVQSKISGRIVEVVTDEGRTVKQGQLLAQLDEREARTLLQQVEVQLAAKRIALELAKVEKEASLLRVSQAQIERDKAHADHERLAGMDANLVAPKALDDAKYGLDGAEEALRVARFDSQKAALSVSTAENQIAELEAKLEETKLQLAEHRILAPFDGMVVRRLVSGGETVTGATALFEVVDPARLIAYLSRPQRELPIVRRSKEVMFTADAWPARSFTADVDLISPVVDQQTGSFKLRMRVRPDDAQDLLPGMFVRARILTEDLRDALMVPKTAVLAEGDTSIVFAVRAGQACRVTLEPGLEERAFVECRNRGDDGLLPGDVVVVSGHQDLKDQAQVEVANE